MFTYTSPLFLCLDLHVYSSRISSQRLSNNCFSCLPTPLSSATPATSLWTDLLHSHKHRLHALWYALGTRDLILSCFLPCCFCCSTIKINQLLAQLRPNIVALVDAFAFTDNQLNSSLGRYDGEPVCVHFLRVNVDVRSNYTGNVYEHMAAWAAKEPLNRTQVQSLLFILSPFLHSLRFTRIST
jgi:hypothetical protein